MSRSKGGKMEFDQTEQKTQCTERETNSGTNSMKKTGRSTVFKVTRKETAYTVSGIFMIRRTTHSNIHTRANHITPKVAIIGERISILLNYSESYEHGSENRTETVGTHD